MPRPKGDAVNEIQPPINYRSGVKPMPIKSEIEALQVMFWCLPALCSTTCASSMSSRTIWY
jgi:hypothetical protein